MASVTTKLSFVVLKVVMMVLGGLFTLFGILLAIITHPFTVFKKVPRNGEGSIIVAWQHISGVIPSSWFQCVGFPCKAKVCYISNSRSQKVLWWCMIQFREWLWDLLEALLCRDMYVEHCLVPHHREAIGYTFAHAWLLEVLFILPYMYGAGILTGAANRHSLFP